jgi:hypothetical protein
MGDSAPSLQSASASPGRVTVWVRRIGLMAMWLVLSGLTLWAAGALWFDLPFESLRASAAVLFLVLMLGAAIFLRTILAAEVIAAGFIAVLLWWLTILPSNNRPWQPDVAQTAWAEVTGDRVTLHNVRNCDYRTELDYTPRWETRTVDLSRLRGMDLAIAYWGSEWMAHPIVSFQFDDAPPVCFSIETRKETGEAYSAVGGLYRQFELVCICADERDVIRVRTNFRQGEDVYLYRTTATPAQARQRFLEYIDTINSLHAQPRWYNAATTNCTTGIRTQRAAAQRASWDWRILVNGYADEMLYEQGALAGDLPFPELKRRARINDVARGAETAPDFYRRIRTGRPGFNN